MKAKRRGVNVPFEDPTGAASRDSTPDDARAPPVPGTYQANLPVGPLNVDMDGSSAPAAPTKASVGKLKPPNIPLTSDIISDVIKSTKYESEITSAVHGPLDCPYGLSDPGGDEEKIRQNSLTVTYLRQSINAGDNETLQGGSAIAKI